MSMFNNQGMTQREEVSLALRLTIAGGVVGGLLSYFMDFPSVCIGIGAFVGCLYGVYRMFPP